MDILIEAYSGIAGDMTVAALLDLGVDLAQWEAELRKLDLAEPWTFALTRPKRHGIVGNHIRFLLHGQPVDAAPEEHPHSGHAEDDHAHDHRDADEPAEHGHAHDPAHGHEHPHRHHRGGRDYAAIRALIEKSGLSAGVKANALAIFHRIAVAEAKLHDLPVETVHFHEVGALDAILDICGTAVALDLLGVRRIYAMPLPAGHGHVHAAHGTLPLPAPATVEILRDFPMRRVDLDFELVTPTGAGIVAALASPDVPPNYRVQGIGYGLGTKDDPRIANVLRIFALAAENSAPDGPLVESIDVIETTLDDSTPEWIAAMADRLRAAGALDVFVTPVQMKKGRLGMNLTVLATPADASTLMDICFRESTTLGVRIRREQRRTLRRRQAMVATPWGEVEVKIATLPGGQERATPELDSCASLAARVGVALVDVYRAAALAANPPAKISGGE